MKTPLFPSRFQPIGWMLFVPAIVIGMLLFFSVLSFDGIVETIINDAVIIGIALGALFIVCSRERVEDEMTKSIRLASLLNSLYIYIVFLVVSTILINGLGYFYFNVSST